MSSLKENVSWTFAGNLAFSAAQWLVIILITKLLGVEELGYYAYGLALVSPIFLFTNLSLRSIQATDTVNRYSFTDFFVFRCFTLMFASLLCLVFITSVGVETTQGKVVALLAMLKISESLSEVYFGIYQKYERLDLVGRSLIIRSALSITFALLSLFAFKSVALAVLALILAYASVLIFYDAKQLSLKLRFQLQKLGAKVRGKFYPLFLTALPLGFTVAVNVLYQSIPRLLIEHHHGPSVLGVFAGVSYFIVVGSTVVNAIAQSALPRLARYFQGDGKAQFRLLLCKLLALSGVIGVIGVFFAYLFADQFLRLVYSREFIGQRDLFIAIMLMAAVVYISGILGSSLTAMQQFKCQAYISFVCVLFLSILCFQYVPEFSSLGAAYCMVAAYSLKAMLEAICVIVFYSRHASTAVVEHNGS